MSDNRGVPKEFNDAISAVCEMVTIADLENMRTGGKGFKFLAQACEHGGNAVAAYDMVMKYSEDPDGTKHIVAETAGKVVADVVFEKEMKKALAQAAATGLIISQTDSPVPGPADIAGAIVFLQMSTRGYVVAKAKSWTAGEFTKETILKLWPDTNVQKQSIESNQTILIHNVETNTTIVNGNDEVQKNLIPSILSTQAQKLTINNVTFNITQTDNLTVRNAIDDIPEVSILLSHILIKPGEKLDLGDKGIYTVKSGDTLSEIVNNIDYKGRRVV